MDQEQRPIEFADVVYALNYTPYSASNPAGFVNHHDIAGLASVDQLNAAVQSLTLGTAVVSDFTYASPGPLAVWTLQHNLNRYPNVSVLDTAGNLVEGDVRYTSPNQLTVTFAGAFSGTAYCS